MSGRSEGDPARQLEPCSFAGPNSKPPVSSTALYNLAKDMSEEKDLSAKMPEVAKALKARSDEWNT